MNFKLIKLDRRHSWNDQFKYMLVFNKMNYPWHNELPGALDFDFMQQWLTEGFDRSQDIKTREKLRIANLTVESHQRRKVNEHWSYSIDYDDFRIYLNEQALTLVKLKWVTE